MFLKSKLCLALLFSAFLASPAFALNLTQESVGSKLKGFKTTCFEILDCQSGEVFKFNKAQCAKPVCPQSTFKIFNALVGLETGVLKDENHPMKWDGKKYELEPWNHDQTLSSAMKNSVVWYFQKVAADVGEERMNKYVKESHYGNEDTTGGITHFWMDSTMKISADEEINFIKGLYYEKLPFSKRSIDIVKKVTEVKSSPLGELHGKTGTQGANGKHVMGWFVGYVVHDGHPYIFATNIQGADGALGRKARTITESILQDAGLL